MLSARRKRNRMGVEKIERKEGGMRGCDDKRNGLRNYNLENMRMKQG
jgi:hypothetical protein